MSITADKKSIENALQQYRQRLDTIPDELFNQTPPGGGWSYAEVYSHILQANLGSYTAVERCTNGSGKTDYKRAGWLAKLILFFGRFPPGKLKAPPSIAAMTVNITKEDARNLHIRLKKRMEELINAIGKSPGHSKIKHPRLGLLNARQWLRFISIHSKHHLKQLNRLDKSFGLR